MRNKPNHAIIQNIFVFFQHVNVFPLPSFASFLSIRTVILFKVFFKSDENYVNNILFIDVNEFYYYINNK